MKCVVCHKDFYDDDIGMRSSSQPYKEEFEYINIYTESYTLKVQRRMLFPILVSTDVEYSTLDEYHFEQTTTFGELYKVLKAFVPSGYTFGNLTLNNARVNPNSIIKDTVNDLENDVVYANYHPYFKMKLENDNNRYNVQFTQIVTWGGILKKIGLEPKKIILRSDNEPPFRITKWENQIIYTVPRFSSLINPILSIT